MAFTLREWLSSLNCDGAADYETNFVKNGLHTLEQVRCLTDFNSLAPMSQVAVALAHLHAAGSGS
jgi:hypothetical protein